ncbi:MAG: hypothetical protein ACXWTT_01675 [Methylobacter sp.]
MKIEFAFFSDTLVIRMVRNKLNTLKTAYLQEAFQPDKTRQAARKLEFHYTPKHGI